MPSQVAVGRPQLVLALEGLGLSAMNAYLNRKLNYNCLFLNRPTAYVFLQNWEPGG